MSGIDVDLTTLLEQTMEISLQRADGPTYGRVNAYDSVNERVSVTPMIPKLTAGAIEVAATMTSVPVEWPRTSTHSIKLPLLPGSIVRLQPMGHDHSEWLTSGAEGIPPTSERRFSISDLVAIPVSPAPVASTVDPLTYDAAWGVLFDKWAVGGADAVKAAALHGDISPASSAMALWMASVETQINTLFGSPPGPPVVTPSSATFSAIGIAEIIASATKLKAK